MLNHFDFQPTVTCAESIICKIASQFPGNGSYRYLRQPDIHLSLTKIFHHHDVAPTMCHLRIKERASIGGDRKAWYIFLRPFRGVGDLTYLARSEVEEFNKRARRG